MSGAIREDDTVPLPFPCLIKADNPQDDPYGNNVTRVFNHFYDPVNNRELTVVNSLGETAVNWALGSNDAFATPPPDNSGRRNHFTVRDAREAMFRALTGQRLTDPKENIGPGNTGSAPNNAAEAEAFRKAYWATTFRALGDVMHLIEDMAQPQHTRNDQHSGACFEFIEAAVTGRESVYEFRVNDRLLGSSLQDSATSSGTQLDGLVYNGYPIPSFNRYPDFFSTQPGGDVTAGRGLADYSNRGFFTVRSLPRSFSNTLNNYQNPPNDPNNSFYAESLEKPNPNDFAESRYLEGDVDDTLTNTATRIPLVVEGLLRAELVNEDVPAAETHGYLLDSRIYDAIADLLVPRGVAYSAGFLNYFFRGRLEVRPSPAGIYALLDHAATNQANDGFSTVKLQLRNATADINDGTGVYPQEMTNGTLFAVAKFRRNPCYQPDLSGEVDTSGSTINGCSTTPNPAAVEEIVVSEPLGNQSLSRTQRVDFVFDFSKNPIPLQATDLFLQVVYRGKLGTEDDAVVVETVDLFEPTYISIVNSSDFKIENSVITPVDDVAVDSFTVGGLQVGFSETSNETLSGLSALPVGNFIRLAILTDTSPFILTIRGEMTSGLVVNRVKSWLARTAQRATDGSFNPSPLNALGQPYRGTNWHNLYAFYTISADTTQSTDFSPMAGAPFAVNPLPLDMDIFNPAAP
ncbi:hypothetical protein [Thiogranum longum]|nr:hypothetical protein [Thiogranum longum]